MRVIVVVLILCVGAPVLAQVDDAALRQAQEDFAQGRFDAALSVIEPAARSGDPVAQTLLGAAYDAGQGKTQSAVLAQDWFARAAEQDHGPAQLALGLMALTGRDGAPPDPKLAAGWLQRAMAQGEPDAYLARAQMMLDGTGAAKNPAAALVLLLTALDLGAPQAAMPLAALYAQGQAVPQDESRARRVLGRAAAMGHGPAMAQLAVMHELGQGGPVDPAAAFTLYQEAVSLGEASAAVNLALFMQDNDGYWRDPPLAHAYCLWGTRNAPPTQADQYVRQCSALAETLTQDDRDEGARIAATF